MRHVYVTVPDNSEERIDRVISIGIGGQRDWVSAPQIRKQHCLRQGLYCKNRSHLGIENFGDVFERLRPKRRIECAIVNAAD